MAKTIETETDEVLASINHAKAIDRAIHTTLCPDGANTMVVKLIPYYNQETGVLMWVSQPTYLAMRVLDMLEDFCEEESGEGISKMCSYYSAPKSERKAIADKWVASVFPPGELERYRHEGK